MARLLMNNVAVIRVLTVDDHPLMMAGIAGEINAQPDMRVVAEATDGAQGIVCFREHRPDVTLMDIRMPNVSGLDAVSAIRREFPAARIVVLTTVGGDMHALRAFKAGAVGYLLKNMLRKDLIDTIRHVHAGKKRIPPEIAKELAEHSMDNTLTSRELDVLRAVAQGNSNGGIASALSISEHTVKNHIKSIFSKLGATDRTHAVMIGLKRGFIDLC
jgi:DNA-binding NarL/FixJ family response regulator